jgi:tetratricopeptide (TPR) repeat protein
VKALAAARQAIQLDPGSGDAYAALGWIGINYGHDWPAIGKNLEIALRLNPNNSLAEQEYSIYLDAIDKAEEGVTHMRRALALDPLSFYMNRHLGSALYFARHYDEALIYLDRSEEMGNGKIGFVENWKSRVYEERGQFDYAEASDLRYLGTEFSQSRLDPLRLAFRQNGWKAYQAARIELLTKHAANDGCELYEIGESYLLLENPDRAVLWLNRGIDKDCYWGSTLLVDPILDDLRKDARYPALLRRMNL